MKVWKHLKSLSDKDVLSFKSYTLKISELLAKLNKSVLQAFSGNINLSAALQSEGLPSIASYQNWIDNIFTEEDEPRLIEILNNPELVSAERISKITDSSQKNRLQKKQTLISSSELSGELLQIGKEWKPCKVVLKMYLEVYVEEDEEETASSALLDSDLAISPLDDIRQSLNSSLPN